MQNINLKSANIILWTLKAGKALNLAAMILFITLFITGCARRQSISERICGKWYGVERGDTITLEFFKDKTMNLTMDHFPFPPGTYLLDTTSNPPSMQMVMPGFDTTKREKAYLEFITDDLIKVHSDKKSVGEAVKDSLTEGYLHRIKSK